MWERERVVKSWMMMGEWVRMSWRHGLFFFFRPQQEMGAVNRNFRPQFIKYRWCQDDMRMRHCHLTLHSYFRLTVIYTSCILWTWLVGHTSCRWTPKNCQAINKYKLKMCTISHLRHHKTKQLHIIYMYMYLLIRAHIIEWFRCNVVWSKTMRLYTEIVSIITCL